MYSAAPAASSTPKPGAGSSESSGLSTQAIIGISVGVGIACILLALISGYFLWRHYRPKTDTETAAEGGGGDAISSSQQPGSGTAGQAVDDGNKPADKRSPREIHELMGHYQGTELTNTNRPVEIDGVPRAEVELRPERFSFVEGATMDFRSGEGTLVQPDESPVAGYLAVAPSKSMQVP